MDDNDRVTLSLVLSRGALEVIARKGDESSKKNIQLMLLWSDCWQQGYEYIETFLGIMEYFIKESIIEVYPHEELILDYDLTANNDELEEATHIQISINKISTEDTKIELLENVLEFRGPESKRKFQRMPKSKTKKNIIKIM